MSLEDALTRLAEVRRDQGLTQAQLAYALSMDLSTLAAVESCAPHVGAAEVGVYAAFFGFKPVLLDVADEPGTTPAAPVSSARLEELPVADLDVTEALERARDVLLRLTPAARAKAVVELPFEALPGLEASLWGALTPVRAYEDLPLLAGARVDLVDSDLSVRVIRARRGAREDVALLPVLPTGLLPAVKDAFRTLVADGVPRDEALVVSHAL
jgi:transcriptional regulator with XRE-family HTH domain